jgi:hypothetical protein
VKLGQDKAERSGSAVRVWVAEPAKPKSISLVFNLLDAAEDEVVLYPFCISDQRYPNTNAKLEEL